MLERFKVGEKAVKPFTAVDDFNHGHTLEGYMCHSDGPYYGSMLLTKIAGRETEQWVFSTPKFDYPFDRQGTWRFPTAVAVEIYAKLDGTNILAYSYHHGGETYVTYKTRLNPVVQNSGKFGPFADMLREMLTKYGTQVQEIVRQGKYHLSFELYGARNKHLMVYDIPLNLCLLFLVDKANGDLFPPSVLEPHSLPLPKFYRYTQSNHVETYKAMQEEDEKRVRKSDIGMEGDEGRMWYMKTVAGKWAVYKMKPPSIEEIHWQTGLSKNVVKATALNVLENHPEITFDNVRELLLETYVEREILAHEDLIRKAVAELQGELAFEEEVLRRYTQIGVSVWQDKAKVMRELSQHFSRGQMKKVYWVVTNKSP